MYIKSTRIDVNPIYSVMFSQQVCRWLNTYVQCIYSPLYFPTYACFLFDIGGKSNDLVRSPCNRIDLSQPVQTGSLLSNTLPLNILFTQTPSFHEGQLFSTQQPHLSLNGGIFAERISHHERFRTRLRPRASHISPQRTSVDRQTPGATKVHYTRTPVKYK